MAPPQPQLLCCAPITAVTHPLSALNDPLVHTGHHAHDGGSARAGQTLQHVSIKMVKSAWAGTYGGWVVGQDEQGLLLALHRQVRRLLARRAASPTLMVGSNTRHSTSLHGVHSTTEGHLGVYLLF